MPRLNGHPYRSGSQYDRYFNMFNPAFQHTIEGFESSGSVGDAGDCTTSDDDCYNKYINAQCNGCKGPPDDSSVKDPQNCFKANPPLCSCPPTTPPAPTTPAPTAPSPSKPTPSPGTCPKVTGKIQEGDKSAFDLCQRLAGDDCKDKTCKLTGDTYDAGCHVCGKTTPCTQVAVGDIVCFGCGTQCDDNNCGCAA